jgi:hypothetical protein
MFYVHWDRFLSGNWILNEDLNSRMNSIGEIRSDFKWISCLKSIFLLDWLISHHFIRIESKQKIVKNWNWRIIELAKSRNREYWNVFQYLGSVSDYLTTCISSAIQGIRQVEMIKINSIWLIIKHFASYIHKWWSDSEGFMVI